MSYWTCDYCISNYHQSHNATLNFNIYYKLTTYLYAHIAHWLSILCATHNTLYPINVSRCFHLNTVSQQTLPSFYTEQDKMSNQKSIISALETVFAILEHIWLATIDNGISVNTIMLACNQTLSNRNKIIFNELGHMVDSKRCDFFM